MSFSEVFKGTLGYAHKQLDDNYEGPHSRKPVTFPPPETEFPNTFKVTDTPVGSQIVSIKSIRTPKFSVEYTVPLSDSVYSLKERLLTDPEGPLFNEVSQYTPASIKLLIKSKVISDTRQLAELPGTSFIAMFVSEPKSEVLVPLPAQIYWGEEAKLINKTPASKEGTENTENLQVDANSKLPGLTDKFWSEIESVARRYVADPKALVEELRFKTTAKDFDLD